LILATPSETFLVTNSTPVAATANTRAITGSRSSTRASHALARVVVSARSPSVTWLIRGLGYRVAWSLPVRKVASSSAVTVRSRDRIWGL
jgi:hypothetical protein